MVSEGTQENTTDTYYVSSLLSTRFVGRLIVLLKVSVPRSNYEYPDTLNVERKVSDNGSGSIRSN